MHSNIVNDNGFLKPALNINNDNVDKYETASKVEATANKLVEKFQSPGNFSFYCKVAYKLSEARIWFNYEQALKGNQPVRLFTYLCNKDMRNA